MKNKRGIVPLLGIIIIVLVFIFLSGSFFFSNTLRFNLIGITIIIATLIIGLPALIKSQNVTRAKTGVFFIPLIIGLLLILLPGFGLIPEEFIGGAGTLSISSANIDGQDLTILTVELGQGRDEYIINFNSDEIEDELDGYIVDDGINGLLTITDFTSNFDIHKSTLQNDIWWSGGLDAYADNFGLPFIPPSPYLWDLQEGINYCNEQGSADVFNWFFIDPGANGFNMEVWCLTLDEIAARGDLLGGVSKDFEISVIIEGEEELISPGHPIATLHGGDVRVQLLGQLESFNEISEVPFDILWQPSEFKYLISESASDRAGISTAQNWINTQIGGAPREQDGIPNIYIDKLNNWNDVLDDELQNLNSVFLANPIVFDINLGTDDGGNYNSPANGDLIVSTGPTGFPVVRLIIDADFIGIHLAQGEPQITQCIPDVTIESGENLVEDFKIKNIGEDEGDFHGSVSCDDFLIDVDVQDIGNVNVGETKTIDVLIGGQAPDVDISGTCTLTVEDFNFGGEDSCEFDVNVEFIETLCAPSVIDCSDDGDLVQCSPSGNSEEVIESCGSGFFCGFDFDNNEFACLEEDSGFGFDLPGSDGDGVDGEVLEQDRADCLAKAGDQAYLGWVFQVTTEKPGLLKEIFTLGFAEEKSTGQCIPSFLYGYVIVVIAIIIAIASIFFFKKPKQRRKKRR